MSSSELVVPPHQARPCRDDSDAGPPGRSEWKLLAEYSCKPTLRPVGRIKAPTAADRRERTYEAVSVTIPEGAFEPVCRVGDAIASFQKNLKVATRRLMGIIEGHAHLPIISPQ